MKRPQSGQEALQWLKEGNQRYVNYLSATDPMAMTQPVLVAEQNPFAIILGCSDARVPVEIVFDQGLGDLFVIRVAGNIVAPSQVGSVEFAVEKFGTRLVVVLGHSHCGAVTACVDSLVQSANHPSPNISAIVDRIRPAVQDLYELVQSSAMPVDTEQLIHHAIRSNVRHSVNQLQHGSKMLEDMVTSEELLIVGAEYNLHTGVVSFL